MLQHRTDIVIPVYEVAPVFERKHLFRPKVIRKKEGMRYEYTHFYIEHEGINILDVKHFHPIKPIPIRSIHFAALRHDHIKEKKIMYYDRQPRTEDARAKDKMMQGFAYTCQQRDCREIGHIGSFVLNAEQFQTSKYFKQLKVALCKEHTIGLMMIMNSDNYEKELSVFLGMDLSVFLLEDRE